MKKKQILLCFTILLFCSGCASSAYNRSYMVTDSAHIKELKKPGKESKYSSQH